MNTDILLHHTSVTPDGRIHVDGSAEMPEGMSYRVLVLPPTMQMTPEVLRKLHELVAAGATIVGPRPTSSPSLRMIPAADMKVQDMATRPVGRHGWRDADIQHAFGKGMTYWGLTLDEVLAA